MSTSPSAPTKPQKSQLGLVVFSSFLGSTMEYYDFLLYGTMSALVFGPVFFSQLDPVAGTIASLGTFAAGYLARPLGGIIFGHFGDRLGRKAMLFWTISLMGAASILIGLVPPFHTIGAWASILLIVLRVAQGIAIGGEWGGSVLMSAEHATSRRGLWASFTPAGAPAGSLLSAAAVAIASASMSNDDFMAWGWRLPFFFSALLLILALIIRFRISESPVFADAAAREDVDRVPLLTVLTKHWRKVLLGIGATAGMFMGSSFYSVFLVSYATTGVGMERQTALNALTIASALALVTTVFGGYLADRFGRRPIMILGALSVIVLAFVAFPAVAANSFGLITLIFVLIAVLQGLWSAATPAFISEMFPTTHRYTGASLTFQLAGIFSGVAPLVWTAVVAGSGGATIGASLILAGAAAVGIICILSARETSSISLRAVDEAAEPNSFPAPVRTRRRR